ncbi:WD40-repeat-containing domain protein [Bombardia bombarda]|uniref:WD40-repeat-containing domain protein n=1 Tax=Bombardia bombarda TaxID=252184 RepID=A0AA39WMD3_9PEZI|nr:WD40-repeat-containing domain protein [Bombardia bombarda]
MINARFFEPKKVNMAQKNNITKPANPRPRLQHNYVLSPITALAFYHGAPGPNDVGENVLVLAGEDTWLKVYHVGSSRLVGQLKVFSSQPIHGIHVSSSPSPSPLSSSLEGETLASRCCSETQTTRLLIWGGQSVAVVPHASLQRLIEGGGSGSGGSPPAQPSEFRAADWIYDGILFPSLSSSSLSDETACCRDGLLVTAHNEVVPIQASADGRSLTFGPLTSPSRPILYSANLCQLSADTVLVAGGTVFGEIIIWKYHMDATSRRGSSSSQWEVLFVFTGHEGSIFGVSISPEIELAPGTKVRLLASCSDDRTIRIWDITDRPPSQLAVTRGCESTDADTTSYSEAARETGFGGGVGGENNSEVKVENRNDSASRCLAVAMGHASRIWHVKFSGRTDYYSQQERLSPVEVHSFGEDCSRQKWELSLDLKRWQGKSSDAVPSNGSLESNVATTTSSGSRLETIGTLEHCGTSSCHSGKNMWSAAVSTRQDSSLIIATGGADGKITISGDQVQSAVVCSDAGQETSNGNREDLGQEYGNFDISLSVDDVDPNPTSPEVHVKKSAKEGFQRYAFLSKKSVLATTTSGRLFLGAVGNSLTWQAVALSEPIVADLKSYNVVKRLGRGSAIIGSGSGKLYLYRETQGIRELCKLPYKIYDIMCLQESVYGQQQSNLWTIIITVLGLDHAIMLTLGESIEESVMDQRQLSIHPGFIVTAAGYCGGNLILGSRIGALAIYKITPDSFSPGVSRRDCKTKDAVTCIVPLPGSSTSFLTGCRDGRYRIYTVGTTTSDGGATTDEPQLHLQHEISPPLGMIEGAWFSQPANKSDIELILYGFRGNNFVVWSETARQELATVECGGAHRPFDYMSPPSSPGQIRLVFTKTTHMRFFSQSRPALRALKEGGHGREMRAASASSDRKYLATAAEDTTIRIWQYRDNPREPVARGFKCLAILEKHSAGIQYLKWHGASYLISSAGSEELFIWRITRLESDYEALAVLGCRGGEEEIMLLSMILSNSTLKSYLYSKEMGFRLLASGRYTGACLTQIRHLRVVEGEGIHVLTAATDGNLAVWVAAAVDGSGGDGSCAEYALVSVARLHQSSVKCLDLALQDGSIGGQSGPYSRWLVATGGDDNALGFLDLGWDAGGDGGEGYKVLGKYRVKDAHAAALTGLCVVKGRAGGIEVATVSNDQRVKLWRAERREGDRVGKVAVSLLDNQYSSVADAGDLEVIDEGRLMIAGVGMEVWDVSEAQKGDGGR